jgi:hypothetical protein
MISGAVAEFATNCKAVCSNITFACTRGENLKAN